MHMKLTHSASAIVTGGASGLGAATAWALADAGLSVVVLDLETSISAMKNNNQTHPKVTYRAVDVTDFEQVSAAVDAAVEIAPLRVVVNCAGICPQERIVGRKGTHNPDLFAATIAVNLTGTFHVLSAAATAMATQDPVDEDGQRGIIINTASVAAFEGQIGQAAYSASKGGVHSLTLTAARDLARQGIRVLAIAPGVVETPMMAAMTAEVRTELENRVVFPQRMARPEEFAQLVQSLMDNDYLNGETIRLDGGLRMPPR